MLNIAPILTDSRVINVSMEGVLYFQNCTTQEVFTIPIDQFYKTDLINNGIIRSGIPVKEVPMMEGVKFTSLGELTLITSSFGSQLYDIPKKDAIGAFEDCCDIANELANAAAAALEKCPKKPCGEDGILYYMDDVIIHVRVGHSRQLLAVTVTKGNIVKEYDSLIDFAECEI